MMVEWVISAMPPGRRCAPEPGEERVHDPPPVRPAGGPGRDAARRRPAGRSGIAAGWPPPGRSARPSSGSQTLPRLSPARSARPSRSSSAAVGADGGGLAVHPAQPADAAQREAGQHHAAADADFRRLGCPPAGRAGADGLQQQAGVFARQERIGRLVGLGCLVPSVHGIASRVRRGAAGRRCYGTRGRAIMVRARRDAEPIVSAASPRAPRRGSLTSISFPSACLGQLAERPAKTDLDRDQNGRAASARPSRRPRRSACASRRSAQPVDQQKRPLQQAGEEQNNRAEQQQPVAHIAQRLRLPQRHRHRLVDADRRPGRGRHHQHEKGARQRRQEQQRQLVRAGAPVPHRLQPGIGDIGGGVDDQRQHHHHRPVQRHPPGAEHGGGAAAGSAGRTSPRRWAPRAAARSACRPAGPARRPPSRSSASGAAERQPEQQRRAGDRHVQQQPAQECRHEARRQRCSRPCCRPPAHRAGGAPPRRPRPPAPPRRNRTAAAR